jgi:hypothetical protein
VLDRMRDRIRHDNARSSKPAGPDHLHHGSTRRAILSIERTVMPSNIQTTYATSLSADILASLAAGTMEMREQLIYNPQANALTSTVLLVQPGSPIPTPAGTDITAMTPGLTLLAVPTPASCSPGASRPVPAALQHRMAFTI